MVKDESRALSGSIAVEMPMTTFKVTLSDRGEAEVEVIGGGARSAHLWVTFNGGPYAIMPRFTCPPKTGSQIL